MANNAIEITDSNFQELINSDKPVLVDFWAEWCGPCKMIGPVVEEVAGEYLEKAVVGKMDVDANSAVPAQFGIRSIPTLMIFKGGELVDRLRKSESFFYPKITLSRKSISSSLILSGGLILMVLSQ
jgi:thioredoxin 1